MEVGYRYRFSGWRSENTRDFGAGCNVSGRYRRSSTPQCRRRRRRFAPPRTTFFHLRATLVFTILRRTTHERSIFPLFLLWPAMSRVNGPFSRFVARLSQLLFFADSFSASLCPIASVALSALRFHSSSLLCLSILFYIGEHTMIVCDAAL